MEPDPALHMIFATAEEAFQAWQAFQEDDSIPQDVRNSIAGPRQALVDCWIFDKVL